MSEYFFPVLGGGRITSGFGPRVAPVGGASTNHGGIDIAAAAGTPVLAPIGGTILNAGYSGASGNRILLRGDDGNIFGFRHLQGFDVKPGMQVFAGQQIGRVGSTGRSTGNHLHYDVSSGGVKVDPLKKGFSYLKKGNDIIKSAASTYLKVTNPAAAVADSALKGLGLGGLGIGGDSCGIICQLKKWIKETAIFQRIALALFAFIVIFAGFYLLKSPALQSVVNKVKG
jgi:murein DD-endopeptidase MepM/ murein hydrolase activator NlpD